MKVKKNRNTSYLKELYLSRNVVKVVSHVLIIGMKKKALEIGRLAMRYYIKRDLHRKYSYILDRNISKNVLYNYNINSKCIWICWLQGIENAPDMVRKCYNTVIENNSDKKVILITQNNYYDYVKFPDYIQEKINNGIITKTHFSDLLRIELLTNYGGTWIDATVLCTGSNIPSYMLNAELFMFQNLKPGSDGETLNHSSWFITAQPNNSVLLLVRELLYEYWKKNNKMVSYFLLHFFMEIALDQYPEEREKIIPFSNSTPHIILLRLNKEFNRELWDEVTRITPFHKLSYKNTIEENDYQSYYDYIMES